MRQSGIHPSKGHLLVLFIAAVMLAAPPATADTYWTDPTGGSFNDPCNWDPCSVPGPPDLAIFALDAKAAYTVSLDANIEIWKCYFQDDMVNMELNSNTYSPWELYIAEKNSEHAVVTMNNGTVQAYQVHIGYLSQDTNGQWDVGSGMTVDVDNLHVGELGTGLMNVSSGAAVTASFMDLGAKSTSSGDLIVNEASSVNVDTAYIGYSGLGNLSILENSYVSAGSFESGHNDCGSLCSTQVDGAASELEVADALKIGIYGQADLSVSNGATVRTTESDGWIVIGEGEDSYGQCSVSGSGSLLDAEAAPIVVGDQGEGYLHVELDGHAHSSGELFVGRAENSHGEVWVLGDDSQYVSDSVYESVIGENGKGLLNIQNGGWVDVQSLNVGKFSTGYGTVQMYESSSELVVDDSLDVGSAGEGYLCVDAGTVTSGRFNAGVEDSGYSECYITGSDSQLSVTNDMVIGDAGYAEMEISDGAAASVGQQLIVSKQANSYGHVFIGDSDVYYSNSETIQPAFFALGGTGLTSGGGVIGQELGSYGCVELLGTDSETASWTVGIDYVDHDLIIGQSGEAELYINDYSNVSVREKPLYNPTPGGPDVYSSSWVTLGADANGYGYVSVDGSQAELNIEHSPLTVGRDGVGELYVSNGGSLTMGNGELWVGLNSGSNGSITVTGTDSRLEEYSPYDSVIGGAGYGEFFVLDNSSAKVQNLTIGRDDTGFGVVAVAGGSVLEVGEYLTVGVTGDAILDLNNTELGTPGYMSLGDADLTGANPGELRMGANGVLMGNGTISADVINLAGIVEPGASIGKLSIDGDYAQDSDGILSFEIAGDNLGEYDVLQVNGDVTLNGSLALWITDGFLPQQGMTFNLIRFTGGVDPDSNWFSRDQWVFGLDAYPVEWQYDLELIQLGMNDYVIQLTSLNTVPEPATMLLLAVGGALAVRSRQRKS